MSDNPRPVNLYRVTRYEDADTGCTIIECSPLNPALSPRFIGEAMIAVPGLEGRHAIKFKLEGVTSVEEAQEVWPQAMDAIVVDITRKAAEQSRRVYVPSRL